ncbi:PQQ-dependent sugar dehydrogenase [Streptomyces acidiscabies]|uniref:PQQ-dependent sugar dehydrogenase n=1 Tax=Streptomyces acidiscabies TaxID=42234 RepID=UPI000951305E|nr:PQQ-dependent sugar dehydrogenase [Streptomyces acidiscabies]
MTGRGRRVEGVGVVGRRGVVAGVAVGVLLLGAGCSSGDSDSREPEGAASSGASSAGSPSPQGEVVPPPAKGSVRVVRTVAEGLKSPWGVAAIPGGGLLVGSRDEGTITLVGAGATAEVGEVPGVSPDGEGGLLGLALSPQFASDRMVYAYFTSESDNRIVRMRYDERRPAGQRLGAPDTVFKGIPKGRIHNGGRIAFGPDGMLYAGTGESGDTGLAQNLDSLGGKILRLTPEGEPAPGNPFPDSPVYSYGHRNVQGLAWDSRQRLFAAEFGQNTWDELNAIAPGGNYGWPEAEGRSTDAKYRSPLAQWPTADASPSGIAYAEGSIWMAGLRGQRLWRIPLNGTEASAEPQAFLGKEYGRLRTVVSAGENKLWVTTSNTDGRGVVRDGDDRILELEVS